MAPSKSNSNSNSNTVKAKAKVKKDPNAPKRGMTASTLPPPLFDIDLSPSVIREAREALARRHGQDPRRQCEVPEVVAVHLVSVNGMMRVGNTAGITNGSTPRNVVDSIVGVTRVPGGFIAMTYERTAAGVPDFRISARNLREWSQITSNMREVFAVKVVTDDINIDEDLIVSFLYSAHLYNSDNVPEFGRIQEYDTRYIQRLMTCGSETADQGFRLVVSACLKCGAPAKTCEACGERVACSRDCFRLLWGEHKEACRSAVAAGRKIACPKSLAEIN